MSLVASVFVPLLSEADDEPQQGKASQQELKALWSDLYGGDPAAANAVIKFYKNADAAVPFLKEKLQPLRLDASQCRRLLKELGSPDEKVWKSAWEKLDYFDPRLAIDLKTLMDEVTEVPARTRMVELCSGKHADSLAGEDVGLRASGDGAFNFFAQGSWWAEHRVERIDKPAWQPKMAWTRAARGVAILEQIGTQEAVKVLQQLASGHPDAFPTKAAKESLMRLQQ
jgi:hypothetical protein